MNTASSLRKTNIAEYLLYMWQIEDIIRANDLDIEKIEANVIAPYHLDQAQHREMLDWYESLIEMMRREDIHGSGHLQINKNVLAQLVQLHQTLLADPRFQDYSAEFYKTLPYVVELRSKAGNNMCGEIETCFNALYGMLLMRLQSRDITPETRSAMAQISRFIATLAHNFHLDEADKLFPAETNE